MNNQPDKILIVRLSSIGDIVLTTPVIRLLKKQFPSSNIHYLTKENYTDLLKANPYLDELHTTEKSIWATAQKLKPFDFDLVIDLHNNPRTFLLKKVLSKPSKTVFKANVQKWVMVNLKQLDREIPHIVNRYLNTLSDFDIADDGLGLDYFLSDSISLPAQIEQELPNDFIALCLAAKYNTKKMPVSKWVELIKKLRKPVVLLGGKTEVDEATKLQNNSNKYIINCCGELNINQSALVLKKASIVVSHDTGLMHIAAALKKPIVSIWGNTVPAFGMYPYQTGKKQFHAQVSGLDCRPCSKIGHKKCSEGHFNCMMQ